MTADFDEEFYYGLRLIARQRALEELNALILRHGGAGMWNGTTLASIDDTAIEYAETIWPKYYSALPYSHRGFTKPWSSIWYHARLQPSNFNVAVWQEFDGRRVLQGLATGTRSSGNANLTLNWVERNFGPEYHQGGVLMPILACFEHYARLLEVQRVLIKNPVDPSKYTRYGYAPMTIKGSTTEFLGKEMCDG